MKIINLERESYKYLQSGLKKPILHIHLIYRHHPLETIIESKERTIVILEINKINNNNQFHIYTCFLRQPIEP